jgi:hypothetical protein
MCNGLESINVMKLSMLKENLDNEEPTDLARVAERLEAETR